MNRLRSYRWIEGLTQENLGKVLGVTGGMVSGMETGRYYPTCDIRLLGYERIEVPHMTEPMHRQLKSVPLSSTRRAKELLRLAGEVFAVLKQKLPAGRRGLLEPYGPVGRDHPTVASIAGDVRTGILFHEESGPIRNLTAAVERAGICLVPLVLDGRGLDGMSSWVEDQAVIGLNVAVPGDRFRMSLAHELGHLAMHTKKTTSSEKEAFRFASALLLPDEDFEQSLSSASYPPTLKDFINLKGLWGISISALVYRAHESGILDDRSHRSMRVMMSRWRKTEPRHMRPVYGRLLPALVNGEGGIVPCAERLGVNPTHLRDIVTWRPLRAI
ncbi:MAG: ImmA/IrrE family metallo-endopeptidase [Actinomycetia bacterium]|nr:ImmA/IrrE family metallo-endopeptidase [Actinomycetes bacterium]